MHASTWSRMHRDTFGPGRVVKYVGVGGSKVWMSMGVGVGKPGRFEVAAGGTISLDGGLVSLRLVLVVTPN